jgi:DNA-binding GntR family transcriptional regulator
VTTTPIIRVQRITAAAEAALHIRRMIFERRLRPGDIVPPADVAAELGISRIPVREAIVALEREGVLTIIPHRGSFVASIDRDSVRDHWAVFGFVYGSAARRTAERATPEIVAKLAAVQSEIERAATADEMRDQTNAFNVIVLEVGGSPRLRALASMLVGMLPGNIFELVPLTIAAEKRGTAKVLRAIRAGEGDTALEAWQAMFRRHGELTMAYLIDLGLL